MGNSFVHGLGALDEDLLRTIRETSTIDAMRQQLVEWSVGEIRLACEHLLSTGAEHASNALHAAEATNDPKAIRSITRVITKSNDGRFSREISQRARSLSLRNSS